MKPVNKTSGHNAPPPIPDPNAQFKTNIGKEPVTDMRIEISPTMTTRDELDTQIDAVHEGLIRLASALHRAGEEAVSPDKSDLLDQFDKDDIVAATEEIFPTLKLLANNIFEPLRENHPEQCKDAYELTWRLMSVVTRLAGQVIVTDSTPNLYRMEFSKAAGKKSGEARRKLAQETWQPHAKELALESLGRKRSTKLSQEKLVEQIQKNWRLNKASPSRSHLLKFVSDHLREWRSGAQHQMKDFKS